MHHRILQFALHKLFSDDRVDRAVLDLLDSISELCAESIDVTQWDEVIERLLHAVIEFETLFPKLMVKYCKYIYKLYMF